MNQFIKKSVEKNESSTPNNGTSDENGQHIGEIDKKSKEIGSERVGALSPRSTLKPRFIPVQNKSVASVFGLKQGTESGLQSKRANAVTPMKKGFLKSKKTSEDPCYRNEGLESLQVEQGVQSDTSSSINETIQLPHSLGVIQPIRVTGNKWRSKVLYKKRPSIWEEKGNVVIAYKSPFFPGSVDLSRYDQKRLDGNMMLNDTIINYYLLYTLTCYLKEELGKLGITSDTATVVLHASSPNVVDKATESQVLQLMRRFFVFTTFFYPMLHRLRAVDNATAIERVVAWSKEANLFSREFVIIPVFERCHWILAVLAYPNCLLQYIIDKMVIHGIDYSQAYSNGGSKPISKRSNSTTWKRNNPPFFPYIMILDSLQIRRNDVANNIRNYLNYIIKEEYALDVTITETILPLLSPVIHSQENSIDCGVFLIMFASALFRNYPLYHVYSNISHDSEMMNKVFAFLKTANQSLVSVTRSLILASLEKEIRQNGKDCFVIENDDDDDGIIEVNPETKSPLKKTMKKRRRVVLEENDTHEMIPSQGNDTNSDSEIPPPYSSLYIKRSNSQTRFAVDDGNTTILEERHEEKVTDTRMNPSDVRGSKNDDTCDLGNESIPIMNQKRMEDKDEVVVISSESESDGDDFMEDLFYGSSRVRSEATEVKTKSNESISGESVLNNQRDSQQSGDLNGSAVDLCEVQPQESSLNRLACLHTQKRAKRK